jgi:sialidase-1
VRIYNRVLDATEVAALYQSGSARVLSSSELGGGALKNGLVGHWTFDGSDMVPNIRDKSGQGNHGYHLNGATSTIIGKLGQAVKFLDTDNYVQIPFSSSLQPNTITVSTWFKTDTVGQGEGHIVSAQEGGGFTLTYDDSDDGCTTDALNWIVRTGGTYFCADYLKSNFTSNTWYHAVGTYDGDTALLYINGVLVDTETGPSGNISYGASAPLCIGVEAAATSCTGGSHFEGSADDVRVYNRALSASDTNQCILECGRGGEFAAERLGGTLDL